MRGEICIGDAVNWDAPLNRGRFGWWSALPDQQRGNLFRDLTMRSHASLVNSPLHSGLCPPGGHGSLNYTAASSQRCTSTVPTIAGGSFTWLLWVYHTGTAANRSMMAYDASATPCLRLSTTNFQVAVNQGISALTASTTAVPTNTWSRVGMSVDYDGANYNVTYCLNGKADGTATTTGFGTTNTTLLFGIGNSVAANPFTGNMDGHTLYYRALSASEIAADYRAASAGFEHELNWTRRTVYSFIDAAPPATNRRRRLICGAAA